MNHSEKADYHGDSTTYLSDHQVREKLQKALAELVLKQPDDPLEFLIKHFRQRKRFHLFSVVSILEKERKHVVDELAHQYNLKVITIDSKLLKKSFQGDQNDYSQILKSLSSFESKYDGIVLDNFPSTKVTFR